jgi:hypothetical protein
VKQKPFTDPTVYGGVFLTVVIGIILIYLAYVFVGFLFAHIWWIVVLFVVGLLVVLALSTKNTFT